MIGQQETVIRVRGEGAEIVWPADALAPYLAQCAELRRDAPRALLPLTALERGSARSAIADWEAAIDKAHYECAWRFAGTQGWRRSMRVLQPKRLGRGEYEGRLFRHADWLIGGGSVVVGVVVHTYCDIDLGLLPPGVTVDRLPDSWFWPYLASAYLLRPEGAA